jgi:polar amino acid transport system substrate-binding protein
MQSIWCGFLLLLLTSSVQAATLKFVHSEFAPFHYARDGVSAGPTVELVSKVCAEAHIACSFEVRPVRRALNGLRRGKADGMFVLGWNEERATWLHFSPPLLRTDIGFFVRQDNPLQFTSLEDLKGYTVAVWGPTYISRHLEQLIAHRRLNLTLEITPRGEHGFDKLSLGRVDAAYHNRDVGNHLIKQPGADQSALCGHGARDAILHRIVEAICGEVRRRPLLCRPGRIVPPRRSASHPAPGWPDPYRPQIKPQP